MNHARCFGYLLAVLVVTVCAPWKLNAQVVGGTVQGTVTDPSGAAVPDVQVEIENLSTAIKTSVTTNGDGFYNATNLLPGDYKLTASRQDFASAVQFTLTVGAQRVMNLTLRVGTTAQTVVVSNAAPDVELGSSEISNVVNATTIRELPLNGRDWTQLATLQPGVATVRTQPGVGQADRGQRGFGTQMTINGGRPSQNNYRLDGVSINDYSNSGPGSVIGADLGSDAVEEFSVLTSNYPAEYGRTSGGVINAITRSGTNQFHGSLYEFARNSALDAANFFDTVKPAFQRSQFGGTAGGPIWKDHTFIFGNYEGLRQSLGQTQIAIVPTATARTGQLVAGPVPVDSKVMPYLPLWPLPNVDPAILSPCSSGPPCDVAFYQFSGQQVTPENFFTTRVDHQLSMNDTLFGTVMHDSANISQPDEMNNKITGYTTGRTLITLEENHSFSPRLANAVRFGYNRVVGLVGQTIKAIGPLPADVSLGFAPGLPPGEIDIGGLTNFSGGLGGISNYNFHWNSFQGYDDAFLTLGKHAIKFGVAVERIQENMNASDSPNGLFLFDSLSNFLQNQPTSLSVHVGGTGGPRYIRQTVAGVYVQDDFRALSNLTVNLGLRYEMTTVPTEIHGKLASLQNVTDSTIHLGNPYYSNATLRNFEPRIGFSWDPSRNGKTAVRSGFGMFDVLPLPYETQNLSLFSAPFYLLSTAANLPAKTTFPNAYQ
ncbi:MAG TPA: TonB-dependent receptor [Candidatus Eremiobacteraceae bacterium]|nr:TonB-dependent receptor [Candidatus Eremiobacteraceae bacterium]